MHPLATMLIQTVVFLIFTCAVHAQFGDMFSAGTGMAMQTSQTMVSSGSSAAAKGSSTVAITAPGGQEVYKQVGTMQCKGADHVTGVPFVKSVAGDGVDFGGDYLCAPTCGGECKPNENPSDDTPISGYAFRCNCPITRCNAESGPVIEEMKSVTAKYTFKVVCIKEAECLCKGGDPKSGYLCNWININVNETADVTDTASRVKPTNSPIRWCACCP